MRSLSRAFALRAPSSAPAPYWGARSWGDSKLRVQEALPPRHSRTGSQSYEEVLATTVVPGPHRHRTHRLGGVRRRRRPEVARDFVHRFSGLSSWAAIHAISHRLGWMYG